jgi:hypothetical protein
MPVTMYESLKSVITLVRRNRQHQHQRWTGSEATNRPRSEHASGHWQRAIHHYLPRVRGALPATRGMRKSELTTC